jgi:hypothetical protein
MTEKTPVAEEIEPTPNPGDAPETSPEAASKTPPAEQE